MAASSCDIRVGISGWTYAPWRGVFYPRGLRHGGELEYASRVFRTIEINGSFYSLLRPETYDCWYAVTPPDFVFSVKGGRFITHMKRLRGVETALANFFASGVLRLGEKLGPILWQLPPTVGFDPELLDAFLSLLPRTTEEAARLASRHDSRLRGRAAVKPRRGGPIQHVLEIRHPSFLDAAYVELLRKHRVAPCIADTAGLYPVLEDFTTNWVYVRLHGSTRLYTSGYDEAELARWSDRIHAWSSGRLAKDPHLAAPRLPLRTAARAVYVYFDNDAKVRAPFDALNLVHLLRGEPTERLPEALATIT